MRDDREETFGPVAAIARFETEEEAIRIANARRTGSPRTSSRGDLARMWRVGEALEYGIVGVNTGLISTEVAPFGGVKESGIGREGSSYGVDDWVELKYWAVGRRRPMTIVEQRDYHVHTGRLPELVRLYETRGSRSSRRCSAASSAPSRPTSGRSPPTRPCGATTSYAERERAPRALQAASDWQAFLGKIQPLIHTQQNRILVPTSFSPIA